MKDNSVIKLIAALAIFAVFIAFCFDLGADTVRTPSYVFLIICTVAVLAVFRKSFPDTAVFYVMLSGMFLKLTYVMYTPVWCRQHDVVDFGAGEGHAAYMEYILHHKALPDFDPRQIWGFFQPPLHHVISAAWMWINTRLGMGEARMHKNVQILPLVYMCVLMVFVYLICRELNMKKSAVLVTMLTVSFHPIYILMSGSINNDALSVVLTVTAIYVAILWYLYPTMGKVLLLALSIGFAMMAKLSAALLAFPVGAMMIYKVWTDTDRLKDRPKRISYILQFIPFALVVFPLGLWWPIRNKLLFGMPMGYIPEVGEHVETGALATFFDIRTGSPFLYMKANGFAYDEHNLFLATIKSSLFGEGDYLSAPAAFAVMSWILLILAVVMLAVQIVAVIRTCVSKEAGPDRGIKILLGVCVAAFAAGYAAFALKGANLSAMDPRYCAAVVSVMSVFTGLWYDRLGVTGKPAAQKAVLISSAAFAAVSAVVYVMIGLI